MLMFIEVLFSLSSKLRDVYYQELGMDTQYTYTLIPSEFSCSVAGYQEGTIE
jgi:hypothetical protein